MQSEKDRKARKASEKSKKKEKFLSKNVVFNKVSDKKRDTKNAGDVKSETPVGLKKDIVRDLPLTYSPTFTEEGWFAWWENQGYFKPEYNEKKSNEKFVIMIPPPNVTGVLHIGHALTLSIEDCVVRWQRMQGKQTLWLPGTDHAGIATQTVVEKKLKRESNLTRHDLGREKFIEEVWHWKHEKGDRIIDQLKKVGSSCDFSRLRFTMDESMNRAVVEAFVRLFDAGVIYRAKRLVNWCCALRSAISDIEVDKVEMRGRTSILVPGYEHTVDFGQMVRFVYVVNGSGERLMVATTRIETMLGDTAVAVHPTDTRYAHLHGGHVIHPYRTGVLLPIVCDDAVDPEFGTGVVKITPAHDATDFMIGQRHGLDMPTIFTDDGRIVAGYGPFSGMKRFDARVAIMASLTELGLFVDVADHFNVLPICSKSKDVIEPMLKDQWYLKCKESAAAALDAQQRGDLKLLPEGVHDNVWQHWMSDCHDWCISRQLWWGHRIPAYRVTRHQDAESRHQDAESRHQTTDEVWVAARNYEEAVQTAATKLGVDPGTITVQQDDDVLDTWFSSQLFPFATLGWPDNTNDLEKYYPGDLLETGHDIIFFWVARMVMIGLRMTHQLPFHTVYLHAMIRDAHGRKMSKSLGNVLDPYDVINGITLKELHRALDNGNLDPRELERAKQSQNKDFPNGIPQCGTDALRFALLAYTAQPRDINLDVLRVNGYRNFCNKIWQAFRYSSMFGVNKTMILGELSDQLSATDHWILHRLSVTVHDMNNALANYNFSAATTAIHKFWIYELCDVYVEYSKAQRTDEIRHGIVVRVLYECLDVGLRLLHPMMPFITEELYQRLPRRNVDDEESICVSPYPRQVTISECDESAKIGLVMPEVLELVRQIRVYRKDIGVLDKHVLTVAVQVIDEQFCDKYVTDVILPLSKSVLVTVEGQGHGEVSNQVGQINMTAKIILSHPCVIITHCVPKNYELYCTIRTTQDNKDRMAQVFDKFDSHVANDLLIRQWSYYLQQQTFKGKQGITQTLELMNRQLTVHTYLAETKMPSPADALAQLYLTELQVNEKLLNQYSSVNRWFITINGL